MAFDIAGGSAMGSRHRAAGRNNQDAFAWMQRGDAVVAVVCDGCGSGAHSEVGAQLGAQIFTRMALELCDANVPAEVVVRTAARAVIEKLSSLDVDATDHFLFTIIGLVVDGARATVFSMGDGLVHTAGQQIAIGPFEGNAPPYLGHALVGVDRTFTIHRSGSLDEVLPVALCTDGADGVDLDALLTDVRTFTNADHVRRRLIVQQREGAMSDDATIVLVRRAQVTS